MTKTMTLHSFKRILFPTIFCFFCLTGFAQPVISIVLNTPANAGNLSEDCGGPYELVIERLEGNTDTITITFEDLGVALNGVDYNFPPGTFPITMLPSQDVLVIPITLVQDGPEGEETLIWEFLFQTS